MRTDLGTWGPGDLGTWGPGDLGTMSLVLLRALKPDFAL